MRFFGDYWQNFGELIGRSAAAGGAGVPFTDDFARDDGAIGGSWLNQDWQIASGQAYSVPALTNRVIDSGMEAWTSATNLTNYIESVAGSSTVNQETSDVHGGSNACRLDVDGSGSEAGISQLYIGLGAGFTEFSTWLKASATPASARYQFGGQVFTLTTNWAQYFTTPWFAGGNANPHIRKLSASSKSIYVDDWAFYLLDLADVLNLRDFGVSDAQVGAKVTLHAIGTNAGVAMCFDSDTAPKYGLMAWHNGEQLFFTKLVNGVLSNLLSPQTVTYAAGAVVEIRKSGGEVSVWYNGTQRGSAVDISAETGIVGNTLHGMLSTNTGGRLDDFFALAS
jgi:hypothetical protein